MRKILLVLFVVATLPGFAQHLTALQYSMGFATGDLSDFIQKPSFRGFTLDYRKLVQSNIGVGIDAGWNVFYDALDYDVYTIENRSFSGKQYRYNNQAPILFAVDYYMDYAEGVTPFAGLGVGTMYSRRNTNMGVYSLEQDAWHFALKPEIGILFDPIDGVSFSLTGKYYYGFEADGLPSQSYFALNFGFVYKR
jgi:outer membrane protein